LDAPRSALAMAPRMAPRLAPWMAPWMAPTKAHTPRTIPPCPRLTARHSHSHAACPPGHTNAHRRGGAGGREGEAGTQTEEDPGVIDEALDHGSLLGGGQGPPGEGVRVTAVARLLGDALEEPRRRSGGRRRSGLEGARRRRPPLGDGDHGHDRDSESRKYEENDQHLVPHDASHPKLLSNSWTQGGYA